MAVKRGDGALVSHTAKLSAGQKESVSFNFDEHPGPFQVLVGPASATEDELVNLQTLSVAVPAGSWKERQLAIGPIIVAPYWWWWWWWCRRFIIRGG